MRRWREAHPELRGLRNRMYKRAARLRRGPEINAIAAAWLAAHPEVKRAKDGAYRGRKRSAAGRFTAEEWRMLVARSGGRCGYCGASGPLEADHRVPLSRGGDNTIANIIAACPRCNRRKGNRTEEEFREVIERERGDN